MEPKYLTVTVTVEIHEQENHRPFDSEDNGFAQTTVTLPFRAASYLNISGLFDLSASDAVKNAIQKGIIQATQKVIPPSKPD